MSRVAGVDKQLAVAIFSTNSGFSGVYYIALSEKNQGVSLVYHPQLVAVYHQPVGLDIIKPQVDARWRVMRYSPEGADDIHDCVVMICQACGLDKQKKELLVNKSSFFVGCGGGI